MAGDVRNLGVNSSGPVTACRLGLDVGQGWETDNMDHDPLCPLVVDGVEGPIHLYECPCDLIAQVRADEKAKWTHTCPDNNCCNGGPN